MWKKGPFHAGKSLIPMMRSKHLKLLIPKKIYTFKIYKGSQATASIEIT